ncbi:MAG: hypothetical protein AB7K68_00375 [Bacteriovoracia bacterium]
MGKELSAVEQKLPEFARELKRGFKELDWYMVDVPLKELPFERTKTPFAIKQASIQIEDNVFTDKAAYAELSKEEQRKHIVHELVRRIFLAAEGTNTSVTEGSVAKATNLLMESGNISKAELQARLESLGYQTKNIVHADKPEAKRKLASMADPVATSVKIVAPITLLDAREVTVACTNGGPMNGPSEIVGPSNKYSLMLDMLQGMKREDYPDTYKSSYEGYGEAYESAEIEPELSPKRLSLSYGKTWIWARNEVGVYSLMEGTSREAVLVLEGGLPKVVTQGAENEPAFTPYGLTNQERHITEVSIVANSNWLVDGRNVSMRNAKNGVTTPIKIDGKKYINCLKEGFEKKSREAAKLSDQAANPAMVSERVSQKKAAGGNAEEKSEVKNSRDAE